MYLRCAWMCPLPYRHLKATPTMLNTQYYYTIGNRVQCAHYRHNVHITGTMCTLQAQCAHCRHNVHITGTVCTFQHYRHSVHITGIWTQIQNIYQTKYNQYNSVGFVMSNEQENTWRLYFLMFKLANNIIMCSLKRVISLIVKTS